MQNKYHVGILGATGAVGQRFIQLLEKHPYFDVAVVGMIFYIWFLLMS